MPWCIKKCPYCDFNSHTKPQSIPETAYIERLILQAKETAYLSFGRSIQSIFIGGGTPNLISPDGYKHLLEELGQHYNFADNIEITMEANPGAQEQHDFKGYREAGINRISLGAQSFDDKQLLKLGRIHSSEHIKRCFIAAREAGFDNINIDVMYGLVEQTTQQALDDLKQAIALQPNHISWYQLTLEPNTYFAKYPPKVASVDAILEIEIYGRLLLKECGYEQYEVSAYAKPNQQCRHNLNYWLFGDYIGLGAGAHGKVTNLDMQQIVRTTHYKMPESYLSRKETYATTEVIATDQLPFEFMLNACRLQQAISFELFEQRTGLSQQIIKKQLNQFSHENLIAYDQDQFCLTDTGHRYLNDVISCFLSD
jgi:oxygen-independent coproporphyrinogen-3 oxidase